ncbi:alpha/beta fold hydrolase [Roseiarcaceae bacterium H3SJ34-1]|uniref:alpha/beta fold hydrolase n=1 Tax=Terripilifer ovatus TaxID=3032367 RepID=UPI003AB967BD|nr:alpha/beta fold hydrolase [Roseiarcaceae bacterium H3SJ34-1]
MIKPKTFVLVHGSWHGGWCYDRVAALLHARGHKVFAPTLTGLADRSHLISDAVTLDTHIADIVNVIDWHDLSDVVLCGHSYGGVPVTGAADQRHERIAALVYLDAYIPRDGQALIDVAGRPMPQAPTEPTPPAARMALNADDHAWIQSKLTPHPNGTRTQKIRLTGAWETIARKTYVRPMQSDNAVFAATASRLEGMASWTVIHVDNAAHNVMTDQPQAVADILEAA